MNDAHVEGESDDYDGCELAERFESLAVVVGFRR